MSIDIIIRPVITEKSMQDANLGKFTFAVHKYAGREKIKKAVEQAFQVTVKNISVSLVKGKRKRVGVRRVEKQGSVWKKAIITVAAGQKIDLFDAGGVPSA